ncbi:MAG: aminopeptidase P family protein [Candidatus Hydrogenedens sp.]|jgi:Xaa-Pro aminopeptidase|nr:aminopeptidase P family protein [Candidatus Hydrogenedens sp.]
MIPHCHDKRIEALRAEVKARGGDAFISLNPADNAWLTGFFGSTSLVVLSADDVRLFCDFRYTEQAKQQVRSAQVVEFSGSAEKFLAEQLNESRLMHALFDSHAMTVAQYDAIKKQYTGSLKGESLICGKLRQIKEESEIARIEAASQLAEDALSEVLETIRPGMEEVELAARIDYAFRMRGAQGSSFETIALFGEHSSLPHGKPGRRPLQSGDIVLIDCGCILDGYCSDLTRTFAFDRIPGHWFQEIYDCVQEAQALALAAVAEGVSTLEVDQKARDHIAAAGYGDFFGHGTGHGVGLEIHEQPRLSPQSEAMLAANMVVTVEPGIYLPEQGGVRIEDLLVVTPSGSRVLTALPKDLRIL